jgi:hypothetical protein
MIKAAGGSHWSAYFGDLDAQKVKEAQRSASRYWLDRERPGRDGAHARLGVDGLITDRPDLARKLLEARGIRWREARCASAPPAAKGMKWWPPFLGAGIRVRACRRLPRRGRRAEAGPPQPQCVGTHFGGSLYAMTDPFSRSC